jgi:hypothetical protein
LVFAAPQHQGAAVIGLSIAKICPKLFCWTALESNSPSQKRNIISANRLATETRS